MQNEWVRPANPKDAARVQLLLWGEGLEAEFVPAQFVVAEDGSGALVGCARAKPLPEGGTELGSVCVAKPHRGRGLAAAMVQVALLGARHPVYALTLVPDVAAHAGFERIDASTLPGSLQPKAGACDAGGRPWVPMKLRRVEARPMADERPGPASFLDV